MRAAEKVPLDLVEIADDLYRCVTQVRVVGMLAECVHRQNERHGNAISTVVEDIENELLRICLLVEEGAGK